MKYFLTFGGPSKNYHNAVIRLCAEVQSINTFDKVIGLNDMDLKKDSEFWPIHREFIEKYHRGYGYWIWKPYIIKKQLEQINEGDMLVYADAGFVINPNGIARLNEYFTLVENSEYGFLSFQMEHLLEKCWTKQTTIKYMECNDKKYLETGQMISGLVILKKCAHSIDIMNKWWEISEKHIYNVDSIYTNDDNISEYIEHRHDQSILSLLCKKLGSIVIKDETYFAPKWNKDGDKYPFWAMRKKSG